MGVSQSNDKLGNSMIADELLVTTPSVTVTPVALSSSVDISTTGMAVNLMVLQLLGASLLICRGWGYSHADVW